MRAVLVLALIAVALGLPGAPAGAQPIATTFEIAPGVSDVDADFVEEGIYLAETFFTEQIRAEFRNRVRVEVKTGSNPDIPELLAYFDGGKIVVLTGSPVWQRSIPLERIATIVHEFTHVYQTDVMGFDNIESPAWFEEGIAEYLSYALLGQLGLLDHQDLIDYDTAIVAKYMPDATLAGVAWWRDFQNESADVYALSHVAVARLMNGAPLSRVSLYYSMLSQGYTIDQVFMLLFGTTPDDFSKEMSTYVDEWHSPGGTSVFDDQIVQPIEQPSAITVTSAPVSVEVGDQFLVTGVASPATICTLMIVDVVDEQTIIDRLTFADGTGDLFWLVTIPNNQPAGLVTLEATCGSSVETRVAILS